MRAYQNFSTTQTPTYKALPQSKPCAAGPRPFSDGAPHPPASPCCLQPKDELLNLVELANGSQETLISTQSSSSVSREPLQRHLSSRCSSLRIPRADFTQGASVPSQEPQIAIVKCSEFLQIKEAV